MNVSARLKKALIQYNKLIEVIEYHDDILRSILEDECAGMSISTDGLVIVYNGGHANTPIDSIDIDSFLKITSKSEALSILDKAGI